MAYLILLPQHLNNFDMRKYILVTLTALITTGIAMSQDYNYLGTYTSNGTPNYLVKPSDEVGPSTLQLVENTLPEG